MFQNAVFCCYDFDEQIACSHSDRPINLFEFFLERFYDGGKSQDTAVKEKTSKTVKEKKKTEGGKYFDADIFMLGFLQGTVSSSSEMMPSLLSYIGQPLKRVWTGITTFATGGYEEVSKDIEKYEDIVVPGTERGTLITYDLTYYLNDVLFNDNNQVVHQYDKSGRDKASYTYANNTRVAGELKKSAVKYVSETAGDYSYLYDGLGNVVQDAKNGNISNSYEYEPFGAVVSGTEPNDVIFTSNGEEYQEATGLQHLRARHLNTAIGRFMSEDPYEGSTGNIMTQNRYAYAENDPVNKRDPGGHRSILKRIKKYGSRLFRRAKRFVKRTAGAIKTFSRRTVSAVKSMANYVRVSQNMPGKAKTVLKYVSDKYISAKHRAEAIKRTLKAKYNSLRKKVSCGIKKSATGGISRKEHYARNQYNTDLPQSIEEAKKTRWNSGVSANAHQFTSKDKSNVKYVSPDGKREIIFDKNGEVVTDTRDAGTYNYAPSNQGGKIMAYYNHTRKDIIPYIIWGNTEEDAALTTKKQRALALLGVYI